MIYIMSCVWLDYMVKYFQCKNCVGSSPKTKKCVASFLVPGDRNPNDGKSRSVIRAAGKREISRDFSRFFDPEFLRNFIDPFCPFRCCVRTRTHEKGFLRLPQSNRFCGELRICEGGGQRKKSCVRKNPGM